MTLIAQGKATLLVSLDVMKMPYRAFLQGAVFSAGFWWLCSAQDDLPGAGGRESNHISKFTAKGDYLGRMTCIGSGHGTVFAMDGTNVLLGWDTAAGDRFLRRVAWTKDRKVTESQATLIPTGTGTWNIAPLPLDGRYLTLRRRNDGYDEFRQRLYSAPTVELRAIRVRPLIPPNASEGTFQGAFSFGGSVYALYAATDDRPQQLAQYAWGSGTAMVTYEKPQSVLDITRVPPTSQWLIRSSKEPEGLSSYNGRLVMGQRFGPTSNRRFGIYLFGNIGPGAPPVDPPVTPWPPVIVPPVKPPNQCKRVTTDALAQPLVLAR